MRKLKRMIKLAIPKKYSHIDFKPPQGARKAAERALRRRADKPQSQRGMTPVGIARARDLIAGKRLSPDTVKRMLAYSSIAHAGYLLVGVVAVSSPDGRAQGLSAVLISLARW